MWQLQHKRSSSPKESLKALETDIQQANSIIAAISRAYGGACLEMRLISSPLAHIFLFLIQWMDCSCSYALSNYLGLHHILIHKVYFDEKATISSHERKASIREFYAVIYPSLQQLEGYLKEFTDTKDKGRLLECEDECEICMEACTKIVLPNCRHAMCFGCFNDWNQRSKSCPFCRSSLNKVSSKDLWVLTSNRDAIDTTTLAQENLRNFYAYIDTLPLLIQDSFFFVYDYMI